MTGWDAVIERNAASELTATRLVSQLRACEVAALAFCRLLERWGRGDAVPATAGARQAALRHAADRVETAIAGLERPLSRYLLELEPERAEADRVVRELASEHVMEIKLLQEHIHDAVGQIVYDRTRRRPMVLPVVIEV